MAAVATGATFSCCHADVPLDFSPFKESLSFERPRGMLKRL
jgi:hypothetical protein